MPRIMYMVLLAAKRETRNADERLEVYWSFSFFGFVQYRRSFPQLPCNLFCTVEAASAFIG